MKIQAELSLYPLKTDLIENAVRNFIKELSESGVSVVPGQMSTLVAGESEEVFRVVGQCFEKACRTDKIVLVVKFSNACPEKAMGKEDGITTSTGTASRVNHTPASHISATRVATSPTVPRVFNNQSVFQQVVRSGSLLKQIFDFFRSSAGQGGGRGRSRGRERGRGKGRRA